MSNAASIIRALLIYSICLPLAIWLGYLLAVTEGGTTVMLIAVILGFLAIPLLLRWHHLVLIAAWNFSGVVFFLPGRPHAWLVMAFLSLMISLVQYTLNKQMRFLHVPSIAWPLFFLTGVVLLTARLTGGIGFHVFGGGTIGGRRYLLLLGAIVGYFALTSRCIPPNRRMWCVALFFLGSLTAAVANLATVFPGLYYLFLAFPVEQAGMQALVGDMVGPVAAITRMHGLPVAGTGLFAFLLARYGIEGIFDLKKYWRLLAFLSVTVLSLTGGFRSVAVIFLLTFAILFYLEGLMRSRLLPVLLLAGLLGAAVLVPFTSRLPLSIQRSLSFLPVEIDPVARVDVEHSTEWRIQMWRDLLPEVPRCLILGKGYSISAAELDMARVAVAGGGETAETAKMAGDYHNGPLSVVLAFGVLGVIGFVWFVAACIRVLYRNYLYGDPDLKCVNTFLLAYFIARVILFLALFGSLYSDLMMFTGLIGLSVSLNGGICEPKAAPAPRLLFRRPQLAQVAPVPAGQGSGG